MCPGAISLITLGIASIPYGLTRFAWDSISLPRSLAAYDACVLTCGRAKEIFLLEIAVVTSPVSPPRSEVFGVNNLHLLSSLRSLRPGQIHCPLKESRLPSLRRVLAVQFDAVVTQAVTSGAWLTVRACYALANTTSAVVVENTAHAQLCSFVHQGIKGGLHDIVGSLSNGEEARLTRSTASTLS
jgi:hypothetical protein